MAMQLSNSPSVKVVEMTIRLKQDVRECPGPLWHCHIKSPQQTKHHNIRLYPASSRQPTAALTSAIWESNVSIKRKSSVAANEKRHPPSLTHNGNIYLVASMTIVCTQSLFLGLYGSYITTILP